MFICTSIFILIYCPMHECCAVFTKILKADFCTAWNLHFCIKIKRLLPKMRFGWWLAGILHMIPSVAGCKFWKHHSLWHSKQNLKTIEGHLWILQCYVFFLFNHLMVSYYTHFKIFILYLRLKWRSLTWLNIHPAKTDACFDLFGRG